MPIVDANNQPIDIGLPDGFKTTLTADDMPDVPAPPLRDTIGAAFRTENIVGSFLADETIGTSPYADDGAYNAAADPDIIGGEFDQHWQKFRDVRNEAYAASLKAQIRREQEDRNTLAASGAAGVLATLAAGLIDLPTLIPGGAVVRTAKGGVSIARSAVTVAGAAALDAGVSELALQSTQELRTPTESAINIGASTIFGGMIGAGASKLMSKAELASLESRFVDEFQRMDAPDFGPTVDDMAAAARAAQGGTPAAAGAEAVTKLTRDELGISGKAAQVLSNLGFNPMIRLSRSMSRAAREVAANLPEMSVYLKMTEAGTSQPQAVETYVKQWTLGAVGRSVVAQDDLFKAMKKSGIRMPEAEFRERVGKAMRRGDVDPEGNEYVSQAARVWRERVFDPLKDEAIKAGLLPKDVSVDTAMTYFSRVYNRTKIEANEQAFKTIVRSWARGAIQEEGERLGKKFARLQDNITREIDELEMRKLRRGSEFRERAAGGEADLEGLTPDDIASAIRELKSGNRPPKPETLTQFLHRSGGLVDEGGELAHLGLTARSRPGFIRRVRRTPTNKNGGLGLDDAAYLAWEEGFFPEFRSRPDPDDLLRALGDDFSGRRFVVRENDMDALAAFERFDDLEQALARVGITDLDNVRLPTSEAMKDLVGKVNRLFDEADDQRIARLKERASMLEADLARIRSERFEGYEGDDHIEEIVNGIYDRITGREPVDLPSNIVANSRGPLKERTFNIPDEMIEAYLESDIEHVGRRYARIMGADVELTRKFGKPDMKEQIAGLREEYRSLRERVEADAGLSAADKQKKLKALNDAEKADVRDMEALRDRLRGTYLQEDRVSTVGRAVNAVNTFNYLRALGGVMLSSLPDMGRAIMVHGLGRWMRDGFAPLVTDLKGLKMSVQEAKLAGAAAEIVNNSRMATLAELTDPYAYGHPVERWLHNAATGFSKVNGMVYWNDFQKSFASVISQSRILGNAETAFKKGFKTLPPDEQRYMAFLGIGEGDAERIGRLFAEHGDTRDSGVRIANTESWGADDKALFAQRLYRAALNKDIDSIIVTKGVGDTPLLADTNTGRLILQFKSFMFASHQRMLMRGVQENAAGVLSGMMVATGVGMMVFALKQFEANREISDNYGRWLAEGVDRSGMLGILMEMNNIGEKVTGMGFYQAAQAPFEGDKRGPASRYAARSVVGSLMGPSFGLASDLAGSVNALSTGTMTESDVTAMYRMLPGRTLPYFKWFLEYYAVPGTKELVQ